MREGLWACESACRQSLRPGTRLFSATGSDPEEVFSLCYLIKELDKGRLIHTRSDLNGNMLNFELML